MRTHRLPRATGLLLVSLLLVVAVAAPAIARHRQVGATVEAVDIEDPEDPNEPFEFVPDVVEIEEGQNVLFQNASTEAPHTFSATNGGFDSGIVLADRERIVVTEHLAEGTYDFFCGVHPFMEGQLVVGDG